MEKEVLRKNKHLRLFRHFHHSEDNDVLENNLTRALALCFAHDELFLYHFLNSCLSPNDLSSILNTKMHGINFHVDIQRETSELVDQCRKVYAVALTETARDFTEEEVLKAEKIHKNNITDLVIQINDILIIIEIKRTGEDCRAQLIQQAFPFMEVGKKPSFQSKSWAQIVNFLFQVQNFHTLNRKDSLFIDDFLGLIRERYSSWIPSTPFKYLVRQSTGELYKRLALCLRSTSNGDNLLEAYDRTAMRLDKPWASEIIPWFEGTNLAVCIWPGNTKTQGWHVYNRDLTWRNKNEIDVAGEVYPMEVRREYKLCHFNRFIGGVTASNDELKHGCETHTFENFKKMSGWIDRNKWPELETFLDQNLQKDWRKQAHWQEKFIESERSYLTLSLGFFITIHVPYEKLQALDEDAASFSRVGAFLDDIRISVINLIENKQPMQLPTY